MNNNNTSSSTKPPHSNVPGSQALGGFAYAIALCTGGFIVLVVVVAYATYLRRKANPGRFNNAIDAATSTDDESSIVDRNGHNHYPKFTYSELIRQQGRKTKTDTSSAISGCSICLADYQQTDFLRLLPDCEHIFHLNCVDPWLAIHATCPICRSSPTPLAPTAQIV